MSADDSQASEWERRAARVLAAHDFIAFDQKCRCGWKFGGPLFHAEHQVAEIKAARADKAEARLAKATSAIRALLRSRSWWIDTKAQQVDQLLRETWALEARIAEMEGE